jgi:hypothetical protein
MRSFAKRRHHSADIKKPPARVSGTTRFGGVAWLFMLLSSTLRELCGN